VVSALLSAREGILTHAWGFAAAAAAAAAASDE